MEHLARGIRENAFIIQMGPPKLKVQLKISNGLIMKCSLALHTRITAQDKPEAFRLTLKVFGKQLFEAKDDQCRVF